MVYELRIYHMHPGRMGAVTNRFKNHFFRLFERHGIKVVNFWTDAEGKENLYYICEFESIEEKIRIWNSFFNDPETMDIAVKSEADGHIIKSFESYIMEKAEFFPLPSGK